MFSVVLNMALGLVNASIHSAAHITPSEWSLIDSVQAALTALQAKRPKA